jgi:hypothetical protein
MKKMTYEEACALREDGENEEDVDYEPGNGDELDVEEEYELV